MAKGSPDLLFPKFFSAIDDALDFYPGQICEAHVQYPLNLINVLDIAKHDPIDDRKSLFKIKSYRPYEHIPSHIPLPQLRLESNEYYYIGRGKKRPVIVLCGLSTEHWVMSPHQTEKMYLCAPIFSMKERHTQQDVLTMQAFKYSNIFYLPPQDPLENESAVRFEMIQPFMASSLQRVKNIDHNFVGLNADIFSPFANHLTKFLSRDVLDKDVDSFCKEYGDLLLQSFAKEQVAQRTEASSGA